MKNENRNDNAAAPVAGANEILAAIDRGLAAGGDPTDWDAPEFAAVREATAGLSWDFASWAASA